jgi:hypothetical protein
MTHWPLPHSRRHAAALAGHPRKDGIGRSGPEMSREHDRILAESARPRCAFHVGTEMVPVAGGFHCPVGGCRWVSGRAIAMEEDEGDEITVIEP